MEGRRLQLEAPEQVLIIVGSVVGLILLTFAVTFPTGWGPRFLLSLESRFVRLFKKRKKWSWTRIDPGIVLGSIPHYPCHLEELKSEGVGAVLALNEAWELYMSENAVQDCEMLSRRLPTPDYFSPSQKDIVEAVTFMRSCVQQGTTVYVHCNGGRGRSVVCVLCYLIHEHSWTPSEAYEFVRSKRKIAQMKTWHGMHKQWRAVKRFARELQAARSQVALAPRSAAPKASARVSPMEPANGASASNGAPEAGLPPPAPPAHPPPLAPVQASTSGSGAAMLPVKPPPLAPAPPPDTAVDAAGSSRSAASAERLHTDVEAQVT